MFGLRRACTWIGRNILSGVRGRRFKLKNEEIMSKIAENNGLQSKKSEKTKKMMTVTINDEEYPIRLTMGAILRFKQETGKELAEAEGTVDNATIIWCCIKSACKREGKKFDLSLMDFADNVDAEDIQGLVETLFSLMGGGTQGEKEEEEKNAV